MESNLGVVSSLKVISSLKWTGLSCPSENICNLMAQGWLLERHSFSYYTKFYFLFEFIINDSPTYQRKYLGTYESGRTCKFVFIIYLARRIHKVMMHIVIPLSCIFRKSFFLKLSSILVNKGWSVPSWNFQLKFELESICLQLVNYHEEQRHLMPKRKSQIFLLQIKSCLTAFHQSF